MSVAQLSESLSYEPDLNKRRNEVIAAIREAEGLRYKALNARNACTMLFDAIDNHQPDSPEFDGLYCAAKKLLKASI